jgi:hypothetical protein
MALPTLRAIGAFSIQCFASCGEIAYPHTEQVLLADSRPRALLGSIDMTSYECDQNDRRPPAGTAGRRTARRRIGGSAMFARSASRSRKALRKGKLHPELT